MGCNTVECYVAWNFHQPTPGPARFDGWRDVAGFIALAGELGFDVIARPGPYICAEWDFGGLPSWLLADENMRLRTADPVYLAAVDQWFDQLIPVLAELQATRGGPVVAVQVENEYGSFGADPDYLDHLRKGLIERGVDTLLFTSAGPQDLMLAGGTVPDVLATVNFGARAAEGFANLRRVRPVGFWAGANHSGVLSGDAGYQPTITSYDYDAPVGEAGELTPKFHLFREVIGRYAELPDAELPAPPPRVKPQTVAAPRIAALRDRLDVLATHPVRRPTPEPIEKLGHGFGLVHYRRRLDGPARTHTLRIEGVRDLAQVFADGKLLGKLERDKPEQTLDLQIPGGGLDLEILVEPLGRVDYGPHPATARSLVWLNGFLLGRLWNRGPQVTLYAPAPLWRAGENGLVVLALEPADGTQSLDIELREEPDLGPLAPPYTHVDY